MELTCPQCQGVMAERTLGHVTTHRCDGCGGVFLARADLGGLVEAENDWHAHQSANTAALPRISSSMPPPGPVERSRAYVETLFKG
ncbi:Zn-finger nucleic acid-binding protein [Marmoricola sp. OAE513]|uniref:TFIIB-type zinc ribbon-containing protein n=1 Tax=Marmoricola sp. OAE513 TaxID=2817894 RepID=UPI00339A28C7